MLLDPEAPKTFPGEENEDNSPCGFVAFLPTDLLPSESPPFQQLEKLTFLSKRVYLFPLRIYGKAIAQCAEQDEEFTRNLPLHLFRVLYTVFPLQLFRMDLPEIRETGSGGIGE
jgi:hypothetical protein